MGFFRDDLSKKFFRKGVLMRRLAILLTFVLMVVMAGTAFAEETPSYRARSEAFLARVIDGKIDEAYDDLFQGSMIPKAKPQEVEVVKKNTTMATTLYGKLIGYEFIKEQTHGSSIVKVVYTLKAEQYPIVWEFYYYRTGSEWILIDVFFSDQINMMMDK